MTKSGGSDSEPTADGAAWIEEAMRHNTFDSLADVGRIAATMYIAARREGLAPAEAKDAVEAAMVALCRLAQTRPTDGDGE